MKDGWLDWDEFDKMLAYKYVLTARAIIAAKDKEIEILRAKLRLACKG